MSVQNKSIPSRIKLHTAGSNLELSYPDDTVVLLSAEYLRVYSPSAEVRGHGQGQEILQHGKKAVKIAHIEKAGRYALQLFFDDKHNTGIYSWDYLKQLGDQYDAYWEDYLERLRLAGKTRDSNEQVVKFIDL